MTISGSRPCASRAPAFRRPSPPAARRAAPPTGTAGRAGRPARSPAPWPARRASRSTARPRRRGRPRRARAACRGRRVRARDRRPRLRAPRWPRAGRPRPSPRRGTRRGRGRARVRRAPARRRPRAPGGRRGVAHDEHVVEREAYAQRGSAGRGHAEHPVGAPERPAQEPPLPGRERGERRLDVGRAAVQLDDDRAAERVDEGHDGGLPPPAPPHGGVRVDDPLARAEAPQPEAGERAREHHHPAHRARAGPVRGHEREIEAAGQGEAATSRSTAAMPPPPSIAGPTCATRVRVPAGPEARAAARPPAGGDSRPATTRARNRGLPMT